MRTSSEKLAQAWTLAEPLLGSVVNENPLGVMGMTYLTSVLGGTDLGEILGQLDPAEVDEYLGIGIDLLARLRSDLADAIHADGVNGAFTVTYGPDGPERTAVLDPEGSGVLAAGVVARIVVAVSRPDLHHGGDVDG